MFGQEYVGLQERFNEEMKELVKTKIQELLGKELTMTKVEDLLKKRKLKLERFSSTNPSVYTIFRISDMTTRKALVFEVEVKSNTEPLDFELIIGNENLIQF